jgi:Asp-tRNA(Asn)/Glu-tRNA(Gln) amidotransferase C subunit
MTNSELKSLFLLSNLELQSDEHDYWQTELANNLKLFGLTGQNGDTQELMAASVSSAELREDKIEASLDPKQIKLIGNRFIDGFFALPQGDK